MAMKNKTGCNKEPIILTWNIFYLPDKKYFKVLFYKDRSIMTVVRTDFVNY